MRQRIYIDTSVIGGYFDAPLQVATFDAVQFMRQQRSRLSELLSKMTKEEIVEYFRIKALKTAIRPFDAHLY